MMKMTMQYKALWLGLCLWLPAGFAGAQETDAESMIPAEAPTAGMMAHTCGACHGTNGELGTEYFVPLAGMPIEQFVTSMLEFREGARPATLMGSVASGFSDDEIQAMARFFADAGPAEALLAAQGEQE